MKESTGQGDGLDENMRRLDKCRMPEKLSLTHGFWAKWGQCISPIQEVLFATQVWKSHLTQAVRKVLRGVSSTHPLLVPSITRLVSGGKRRTFFV